MPRLFRKSFLENYTDHDELLVLLPGRSFKFFIPIIATFSFIIMVITCWLFFAQIDIHIKAHGMILPIGGVRESVSLGSGRVVHEYQYINANVESGDPLFDLSDPITAKKYHSETLLFRAVMAKNTLTKEKSEVLFTQKNAILAQKKALSLTKINNLNLLHQELMQVLSQYQAITKQSISEQRADLQQIQVIYRGYIDKLKKLKSQGFASDNTLIPILSKYESLAQSLSQLNEESPRIILSLTKEKKQLEILKDTIDTEKLTYQKTLMQIEQNALTHGVELAALKVKEETSRQKLIDFEYQYWVENHIFSEYDGQLLATKKRVGQIVTKGETLSLLSVKAQQEKQMLIISPNAHKGSIGLMLDGTEFIIPITDISTQKGMRAIQQELTAIPALDSVSIKGNKLTFLFKGNDIQLTELMLTDQTGVPVFAALQLVGENRHANQLINIAILRYEDAKLVQQGNTALIKPLYERTLIGASLAATVSSVSPYALTQIQSYSLIGNSELANKIIGDEPGEIVLLNLNRTQNGDYDWGGRQPLRPITAGVPTTSLVTIDSVAPIDIILPYIARIFIGQDA